MPADDINARTNHYEASEQLKFKYLPAYAKYLLDNQLEEFSRALLVISRDLKIPLLSFFDSLPEETLIAMGVEGNTRLLTALADGTIEQYLEDNLRSWKENQLPLIQNDDVVIEDISKVNFSRRKAFREFLPGFTTDLQLYMRIMEEVDRFTLSQDEVSYKTLFEMKEQKIRENHHFIDKINNTSPGIIYVYDRLLGKEIYTNHKREQLLGYTDDDMQGMGDNVLTSIIHPDDLQVMEKHLSEFTTAGDGEIRTVEYRVRNKKGRYSWQRGYETAFKCTDEGIPEQIIGIAIDITKEKEATLQLERREQQLEEAQDLAGMGSFEWDLTGNNNTVLSDHLLKIFEMDGASNMASFMEHIHPSDRAMLKEAIDRSLSTGEPYECEYRYRNRGHEKVIWSRGKMMYEQGKPVRMLGTIMDVTLRHDMVKRLERSEQLHKQAQALTHLGNWSWFIEDHRVEWSDEMYRIFGLEPQSENMTLGRILQLIHPDDREARRLAVHQAMEHGTAEDYLMRVITPDGTIKIVEGKNQILLDDEGKPYKLLGTLQDITKQFILNERLKENEEASRQLINNAPEGIVVIDEQSRIILWNPKAEVIFGWTEEEIVGKTLMETIIPVGFRDMHNEGVKRHQQTGVARVLNKTLELTALKKSGKEFHISLTVSKSVRAGMDVFISFIRDITQEKATALKLVEQTNQLAQQNRELERRNQELTTFNYIASHDLKEPVRKIKIFTNIITERGTSDLPTGVKDALDRITGAANHMQKLIDALVAFSRTSTGEHSMIPIDLNEVVEEVKNILAESIAEKEATIVSERLPVLRVIPFQMQQLLENIISNALKYSRPDVRPEIRFTTEVVSGAEIRHTGADPGMSYHRISVSDNGIGFEPQYAAKVFELFQRLHNKTEYSGTGIGLAIAKKIVQNHDGFITAESELGKGATFHIYLPAAE